MTRILLFATVLLVAHPIATAAQSLATVAKEEEARRKTVKEPGKVYTNTELRKDITATPPPPATGQPPGQPAVTPPTAPSTPGAAAGGAEKPEPRDEKYWRERITAARAALGRSNIFADSLQTRINVLASDIVNRDDPAQRAQLELERARALSELDRVKNEVAEQSKAIVDIEEEARRANVPPGWLRPKD